MPNMCPAIVMKNRYLVQQFSNSRSIDFIMVSFDYKYDTPSVIRLQNYVKRPLPKPRLTRKEIFIRDGYKCQYCGIEAELSQLTIDHVIPRRLGGLHEWENVTTACSKCNHRKGGRTPAQANMRINAAPVRPRVNIGRLFVSYIEEHDEWQPYLAPWMRKSAA